jgi:hypothetical protein
MSKSCSKALCNLLLGLYMNSLHAQQQNVPHSR